MANERLAIAYDFVNPDKAARLRECATFLTFREYAGGERKLESMNSCRVRLCPMCAWRRSLRNYYNNAAIASYLGEQNKYTWLALTLTIKNCDADELNESINHILYSFNKLMKQKHIMHVVKGFYRGLEITHDGVEYLTPHELIRRPYLQKLGLRAGDRNPTFDTYHPHIHCLVCVNKSYYSSRDYISHVCWVASWKQALGVEYEPILYVQRVRADGNNIAGAIGEISKYSVKPADYIYPEDIDLSADTVRVLDAALAHRRLITYGGVCREAKNILKLQDADTGDLINVDEADAGQVSHDEAYELKTYFWHTGYREYISTT